MDIVRTADQCLVERGFDRVIRFQRIHPTGQVNVQSTHGESVQKLSQQMADSLRIHGLTIRNVGMNAKILKDPLLDGLRFRRARIAAVDDHQKGLVCGAHICNGPAFGIEIVAAGDVGDGAVGGYHQSDGAMLLHDFSGTQLCRVRHRDLVVEPRGGHHSGDTVLVGTHSPIYHIAHGVDKPHPEHCFAVGADLHRFLGDKFRLRGHDGFAGAALGQFVPCPFLPVGI